MGFWLEFEDQGQGHRQRRDFDQAEVSIGRDDTSDFHLDHPTVSRQHALIVETYGNHQLVVLSRNGLTAIDGQVVSGRVDLRPGMTIQVGEVQLGFRAAIGNSDVGEVATEAVSLSHLNPHAPTAAMNPIVEERTEPARDAFDSSLGHHAPAHRQQQSFGNNPGGSGFGPMALQPQQQQPEFGQTPAGSGFGPMSIQDAPPQHAQQHQPPNGSQGPNGNGAAPPRPAGARKGGEDEFKIKSWEEIAAEAATGAHDAVSGPTDFERIQRAQAKAQKKSGPHPALLVMVVLAVAGMAYLFLMPPPPPPPEEETIVERCEGLKICYPLDAEPKCQNKSDCEAKAQHAYAVADQLVQKKDADITNRYEAYKQLDKAGRFMAKAGLEKPPESMKDYDTRILEYEQELDQIATDHRIRHHRFQQRRMFNDMASNVRSWQAYFPDTYNTWFREAIDVERRMRDSGSWPKEFK